MTLSAEDIRALIADFRSSDWDEMAVTTGDVSIVISRSGSSQLVANPPSRPDMAAATAPSPAPAQGGSPAPVQAHRPEAGHEVTSPTVGLFWRSPQPGSPPFVEVGQRVEADDTVCIIEVMKLMNHVKAGRAGIVVSIETENGAMVEYGTLLMLLEPDD